MGEKTRNVVFVGVMAALVFVSSRISVPIPLAVGNTRLHLGNVFCLLSGFLLGPVGGGLAAGIGSMIFDLTDPLYISYAPFTFAFKFAMAFVCGLIAYGKNSQALNVRRNIVSGLIGMLLYIILHLTRTFLEAIWFRSIEFMPALASTGYSGLVSLINGAIAVIAAVPLGLAIKKGLAFLN